MDLINLLFGFQGRINRSKYWLAVVIWLVIWCVLVALLLLTEFSAVAIGLAVIVLIPSTVSGIAVGIKRLHDRDKSGWWLLIFYVVPPVLDGIGNAVPEMSFIFSAASLAITIWMFVELGFLRGTRGPNRYGPDPLAEEAAAH